jgi:hypothetical protein
MKSLLRPFALSALVFSVAACHDQPTPSYEVGGTVSGLTAGGLVLQDNGANDLTVAANASSFQFSKPLVQDSSYDVTIETQPAGLICSVSDGAGTAASANVIVTVRCIPNAFVIAGTVAGLSSSGLILLDNGTDRLVVPAGSNSFRFPTPVAGGGTYDVRISAQPADLTCTVSHGTGTGVTATVDTVSIACSAVTYTIGGSVAGLTATGLVLRDDGGDDLTIAANATSFRFATPIAAGGGYAVTVAAQPAGLTCSVSHGTGTQLQANATAVQVTCSLSTVAIGGVVTGLTGSGLVLQDNGGDDLSVTGAGSFTFATAIAYGGGYAVTVLTQPAGQTCTVTQGSGPATQAVTSVAVACANIPTYTLTPTSDTNGAISPGTPQVVNSGGSLTLTGIPNAGYAVNQWFVDGSPVQNGGSVFTLSNVTSNATIEVTFSRTTLALSTASLGLETSGNARILTLTNTGSLDASNLVLQYPLFPAGTTGSSTCGSTLAVGATCTITITPGASATSDGSNACTIGTAPVPGNISVSADDASPVTADVLVLGYGCIYQGGYVYSVDDTTPVSSSIGGAAVETSDAGTLAWSNGSLVATGASSSTDGAANTATIIAVQGAGSYAASACVQTIAGYSDWYLPAINQLIAIYQNANGQVGLSSPHWSSTENSTLRAWLLISGTQVTTSKNTALSVRCVRNLH